jgi:hypothetical protein
MSSSLHFALLLVASAFLGSLPMRVLTLLR